MVEVRDDDGGRDRCPRDAEHGDRASFDPASPGDGVPHAETGDHERDLLLARGRRHREDRERHEPVLVQEPEGEEEQRCRERNRMELVQRQPSRRRIGEIHEREAEPGARRPEVLAREPPDRDRSEPDSDGLADEEHVRARPDPPQRREQGEDRVDVRAEARHLVALQVGDLEQVAVGRRPHRLHHVPEIEAAGRERLLAQDGQSGKAGDPRGRRDYEQNADARIRNAPHRSRSMIARQRGPSTASLARSP